MPDSQEPKQGNNNDLRNAQFGGGFINAENVNAGRIGGDIWNIFFGQQTTPVGNPARPKNERILLAAVKEEVTARLSQSLHNAVLINLGKESQPQQVKRPWDAEIKIGLKPAVPLPDTTTILEVFDSQEIAGKLLILGAPGSGKTTTQLELAQELIKRAEEQPNYPVPVLFNLSSWKDDRQSLTDWLVAELKSKYGVSKKLGKEWVDNHQLLPLLDGLDELEPQRQELCVDKINEFLTGETRPLYLAICSRIEEYSYYATQLQLNGAIYLQPLTNNQICDYLSSIDYRELWSTISNDLDSLELVKTPLLLSITVLASQEISVESWQHLNSTENRIQCLLDAYIRRMLTRNINSRAYLTKKTPNARRTRMWLVWLAQQMLIESKTEFLIEEIQPSLLSNSITEKIIYILVSESIAILIVYPMLGLALGLIFNINGWSVTLLFFGISIVMILLLFLGIFYGLTENYIVGFWGNFSFYKISLVEKFTLKINIKSIVTWLILWLFYSLFVGLLYVLVRKEIYGLFYGLIAGLMGGLIFGLIFGLIRGQPDIIENKKKPNQGIWISASNAIFSGLIFGIFGTLFGSLIFGLFGALSVELAFGLFIGLLGGLCGGIIGGVIGGLFFGGSACIQHSTLRLILYFNGYIPWNYARFLDYCTERMLLQRVGGRYRFIHKLLQDHFAQMEFKRD